MTFLQAGQWGPHPVLSGEGKALPAATFEVFEDDGTTPATLYTDETKGSVQAQPVGVDALGNATFFADPGRYVIKFTVGGASTSFDVPAWVDPGDVISETDANAAFSARDEVPLIGDYAEDEVPVRVGGVWVSVLRSSIAAGLDIADEWDVGTAYTTATLLPHDESVWVNNDDTDAGDEPGVSGKWTELPAAVDAAHRGQSTPHVGHVEANSVQVGRVEALATDARLHVATTWAEDSDGVPVLLESGDPLPVGGRAMQAQLLSLWNDDGDLQWTDDGSLRLVLSPIPENA